MAKKYKITPEEMVNRFRDARMFDSGRFEVYRENQAFYEGAEDLIPSYNPDTIWTHNINVPYASMAVIKAVSSLQSNRFIGRLIPYDSESADLIERVDKIVQDVWKEADVDQEVNDAIEGAAVLREHYTHVVFNEGRRFRNGGLIKVYGLDPSSVVIDPNSNGLEDASYVFVVDTLTDNQMLNLYDEKALKKVKDSYNRLNNMEQGRDLYYNTRYAKSGKDEDVIERVTLYEHYNNTVYKTVMINGIFIEEPHDLLMPRFPIAQLRWQRKLKSPYGVSLIEKMIPSQKAVNEIESAAANAALLFSSPSFLVDTSTGLTASMLADLVTMPNAVIGIDGQSVDIDKVARPLLQYKSLDEGMLDIRQQQIETINDIAGITEEFEGEFGTSGNTASGAEEALTRARLSEVRFKQQLQRYIESLARIIADIVVKEYPTITQVYYTQAERDIDGNYSADVIDTSDIDYETFMNTPYGFYVDLDNLGQSGRESSYMKLQELLQIERQYGGMNEDPDAVIEVIDLIKMMDFEGKDDIVKRYIAKQALDNEAIAEAVTNLTATAIEFGIDDELLNAAIIDVINRDPEMANVEAFLEAVDKAAEEQAMHEQAILEQDAMELKEQLRMEQEQQMLMQQHAQAQEQERLAAIDEDMANMDMDLFSQLEFEFEGGEVEEGSEGEIPVEDMEDMEFELEVGQ